MNSVVKCVVAVPFAWALLVGADGASKLLPFQGRLTDASGNVITDESRIVQFRIYDAPVGGQAVWQGEVQKLTVNAGLVNTVLGSKASLANVDFTSSLYLELTVDANGDEQITVSDPPLLPRQSILPAVFATESADSQKLAGQDWTSIFGVNDPRGPIPGSKLAEGSLPGTKIQASSITAAQIAMASISGDRIASESISAGQLGDAAVTLSALAAEVVNQLVPPGTVMAFAGDGEASCPAGWVYCDGRAVKAVDYPRLWQAIGTRWGNGSTGINGESTPGNDFNLPDLRGQFLRGRSAGSLRDPDAEGRGLNRAGGETGNRVGSTQGDMYRLHSHDQNAFVGPRLGQGSSFHIADGDPGGAYGRLVNTLGAGGSETRPKNAYVDFIIKY